MSTFAKPVEKQLKPVHRNAFKAVAIGAAATALFFTIGCAPKNEPINKTPQIPAAAQVLSSKDAILKSAQISMDAANGNSNYRHLDRSKFAEQAAQRYLSVGDTEKAIAALRFKAQISMDAANDSFQYCPLERVAFSDSASSALRRAAVLEQGLAPKK